MKKKNSIGQTESGIKKTQVFTPKKVTNQMLDMLDKDTFAKDDTYFFEPTVGKGDMLVVIIDRIFKSLLKKYSDCKDGEAFEKALAETCVKFFAVEIDESLAIQCRINAYKNLISKAEKKDNFDYKKFSWYLIARVVQEKIVIDDFFQYMEKYGDPRLSKDKNINNYKNNQFDKDNRTKNLEKKRKQGKLF